MLDQQRDPQSLGEMRSNPAEGEGIGARIQSAGLAVRHNSPHVEPWTRSTARISSPRPSGLKTSR